jgi:hypothetical protein
MITSTGRRLSSHRDGVSCSARRSSGRRRRESTDKINDYGLDSRFASRAAQAGRASVASQLIAIATINVWNRLNAATRQPAGVWKP